jgi:hypothetical protein
MIAEIVNTYKEMVRQILHDQLNMKEVCTKMVLKNLTQKTKRQPQKKKKFPDITKQVTEQLDVLENAIMGFFNSRTPTSQRMSNSQVKAMMIIFFDIRGVIMIEWVPESQTVNQKYYLEVLTKLQEQMRKKIPELWKKKSWILHQDNAPVRNALAVKQFFADKCKPVLKHSSPHPIRRI